MQLITIHHYILCLLFFFLIFCASWFSCITKIVWEMEYFSVSFDACPMVNFWEIPFINIQGIGEIFSIDFFIVCVLIPLLLEGLLPFYYVLLSSLVNRTTTTTKHFPIRWSQLLGSNDTIKFSCESCLQTYYITIDILVLIVYSQRKGEPWCSGKVATLWPGGHGFKS